MPKICPVCGITFNPINPKRIYCSLECKKKNDYIKYVKAACIRFAKNNPERIKAIQEKYRLSHPHRHKPLRQRVRLEVLKYLSDDLKCTKCGFSDYRALQIDHVNGGGRKESRELRLGNQERYWRYILALPQEDARRRYTVLCSNCNFIKLFEENEFIKR